MLIVKRSGREVLFDKTHIANAIAGANRDVSDPTKRLRTREIDFVTDNVAESCESLGHTPAVEEVQDLVENELMRLGFYDVARAYVTYRFTRKMNREKNTTDDAILSLVARDNEIVKQENSNKNPTINSVQRDYIAGEVSKDLTRRVLLPPEITKAHDEGIIHFHDADYFLQPMHNCFSGDTELVTEHGSVKFNSMRDGQSIRVVDQNGVWRDATVHTYGKQAMQRVVLRSGRSTCTVRCTPNHRWILSDGSVTTALKAGDKLARLPRQHDPLLRGASLDDSEYNRLFCLGFAIGDGCDIHTGNSHGMKVRLRADKQRYLSRFLSAGHVRSRQSFPNGDIVVTLRGEAMKQNLLDGQTWRLLPRLAQKALFEGYYAAGGSTKQNCVATSDIRALDMVKTISSSAGYYVSSVDMRTDSTACEQNRTLFTVHFRRRQTHRNQWVVDAIEPEAHASLAWCVEEPVTHSFTLAAGIVTGNCDLVNMDDMLQNGTNISGTHIDRPHSFLTACNIATQIIAQVGSNQYGGQSFSLAHLAKFVDVSRQRILKQLAEAAETAGTPLNEAQLAAMTEAQVRKEIASGIQTIQYQIVTLMTTNGQAPFVTEFLDMEEAGGDPQLEHDLALCIEETLNQRIRGLKDRTGAWITPAFPKLIYALTEDNISPDGKWYRLTELAAKCTAKRMVPDYVSTKVMRRDKLSLGEATGGGDVYPPMGCRSFLTPDRSGNGYDNVANAGDWKPNEPKYYGRFNQGVVTINLVDVALSAHKDEPEFWRIFDERLELCHRALQLRHKRLLGTPSDVAPILWQDGALARLSPGETIDKLLFDGYSTISLGYAGLYECVRAMTGRSHTDPETKPFALAVMQKMNEKCNEWKVAENIDYSLYGTPLESTTYKFAKCLQKRFGVIKGITDHNYITNSYHVNVREKIDALTKLKFESEFQPLSPGGCISYIEVPDMQGNIKAILNILRFIYDNIMYAELNTKSDHCDSCGYDGEIKIVEHDGKLGWCCPACGCEDQSYLHVARRTCGYIGTQFWNQGRTQEIRDRVVHVSVGDMDAEPA